MTESSARETRDNATAGDRDGKFAVTSPLEITQILQNLARRAVLLTAYLDDSADFFLTSVLGIDGARGHLWLDTVPSQQVSRILRVGQLACSGSLDKVQILFSCSQIEDAEYDGRPAFKAALPQALTRLQRREHFRIQTPITAPLKCVVTVVHDDRSVRIEVPVSDISCGGLALSIGAGQFEPEEGVSYPCTISLPGAGALAATIEAHHTHIIKGSNGKESRRCGFSFIKPPSPMVSAIQRYIMQLERERRARAV